MDLPNLPNSDIEDIDIDIDIDDDNDITIRIPKPYIRDTRPTRSLWLLFWCWV